MIVIYCKYHCVYSTTFTYPCELEKLQTSVFPELSKHSIVMKILLLKEGQFNCSREYLLLLFDTGTPAEQTSSVM